MAAQLPIAGIGVPERVLTQEEFLPMFELITLKSILYALLESIGLIKRWLGSGHRHAPKCVGEGVACGTSLAGQMHTFMGSNMDFFMIFQQMHR